MCLGLSLVRLVALVSMLRGILVRAPMAAGLGLQASSRHWGGGAPALVRRAVAAKTTPLAATRAPLPFSAIPYDGMVVDLRDLEPRVLAEAGELALLLEESLSGWRREGKRSAWVKVPVAHGSLLPVLQDRFGFELHHANTVENLVVLKLWLRDSEDKVPPFATHQVGCAGFVLSEEGELLVIREWTADRKPNRQWKLPGGLMDPGESFQEAACREVLEETGVETDFDGILTLWNRHGLMWGKSDIYVVCLLRPKVASRKTLHPDPEEIAEAKWIPLADFVRDHDHPLILRICDTLFGLRKDASDVTTEKEGSLTRRGLSGQPSPRAQMKEFALQWPNRPVIPTYIGVAACDGADDGAEGGGEREAHEEPPSHPRWEK